MPQDNIMAFPSPACGDFSPEYGMSLRDWFAGQALVGIFSSPDVLKSIHTEATKQGRRFPHGVALSAYEMADAMLAERAKGGAE